MVATTDRLAAFVSEARFDDLPGPVVERTERAILDTIASLIGGVETENARGTRQAAAAAFGSGDAPVWLTGSALHPLGALLANCAAASALDIDDGHRGAAGHPGAAIVPAVLMEAARGGHGGRDVLTATALGYDVALRVAAARRFTDTMSFASGRWTGYGVAAALGWLRRLPPDQIAHGIAIAGAEAPQNLPQGDCRASSVKGSSPWSTVTAAVAVDRAACGLTGSTDLLDRAHAYDVAAITAGLGERWLIAETYLKPYAACRYVHPVIDAVLVLLGSGGQLGPLDRLVVDIFPEARKLPNETAPTSLEGAQFSIPFAAALATIRGAEAFRPLHPSSLADADVLALAARVEVRYPQAFAGCFPTATPAKVTLVRGGEEISETVLAPLGDPANPMSRESVEEKLRDLGRDVTTPAAIAGIIEAVGRLRLGKSAPLLHLLAAGASAIASVGASV